MNTSAAGLTREFEELATLLPRVQFPLPIDGAAEHRRLAAALDAQLRDYLLPRSRRLDAPLLVVVGGSTGAGKSTLVNALLRAEVTRPGVLRPTTKSPVLICNPADLEWYRSGNVLPTLTRSETPVHDSRALQVVPLESLSPGLALVDAPDIDSVDDDNRRLSRQLLQAADVWLFVTSAARYADAVGWEILEQAAQRNIVISLVLNRSPDESVDNLTSHLRSMLAERELSAARVFSVVEYSHTDVGAPDEPGSSSDPGAPSRALSQSTKLQEAVRPVRAWLESLAAEEQSRADVAVQSLAGSTRAISPQLEELVEGLRSQAQATASLRQAAETPFQRAAMSIGEATSDGTMLRGEVLSRWQDFVGTGDFMRSVEQGISAVRDRLVGWFGGNPSKADQVKVAITDGLAALIIEHCQAAHQETVQSWSITRWGRQIVEANPHLEHPTDDFDLQATQLIRRWQASVLEMVGEQGKSKRFKARVLALGTNAVAVALIIVVFASTGGLTTAEVGIAGGASVLAQRLLEGVFGEDAVRRLARQAKADLDERVEALLATQLARFEEVVDTLAVPEEVVAAVAAREDGLRAAVQEVFSDLTRPEGY